MQIIIDTEKSLSEVTTQFSIALNAVRKRYGWDAVAQTMETQILHLAVSEWADKAPESIGRLKRIHRAISQQQ
ncbi:MAG: hypothetical protein KJ077_24075 [Anaerolineae bacterium]|nr:hypothetical protein [Anaerolineae bacterium]